MAYKTKDGQFRGYAIDICEAVKKTYSKMYGREIAKGYVEVTAANRDTQLLSDKVSTICGAFSVTEKRLEKFDVSFLIFASGASVATLRPSNSILPSASQDKSDEPARVVVVSKTTTESLVEELLGTSVAVDLKPTHYEAFNALAAGEVKYYFGDRVILNAVVGRSKNASDFVVGGKFLTYEPYAMPFRKGQNADLQHAANVAITQLYRSGDIHKIFDGHLKGQRPSDLLLNLFQLYSLPE